MARAPYKLRTLAPREHPLQTQIARTLTIEIARAGHLSPHGVVWFSVDQADYGGAVPGTRVARGIIAGIPDVWFLWRGRYYVIEIKTDDGVLSEPQQEVLVAMARNGGRICVARDAFEVLHVIDVWGLPRARRVIEGGGVMETELHATRAKDWRVYGSNLAEEALNVGGRFTDARRLLLDTWEGWTSGEPGEEEILYEMLTTFYAMGMSAGIDDLAGALRTFIDGISGGKQP